MHCGNQKQRMEVAWQRTGVMRLGARQEAGVPRCPPIGSHDLRTLDSKSFRDLPVQHSFPVSFLSFRIPKTRAIRDFRAHQTPICPFKDEEAWAQGHGETRQGTDLTWLSSSVLLGSER